MTFLNIAVIYKIARHEFVSILVHPLIPFACIIVIVIALLSGAGCVATLQLQEASGSGRDVLLSGFRQSWGAISVICTVIAIFLGATTISYERWKNSLNILLSKPLYRKDCLMGKFVGLSAFMFLFNTFSLLLVGIAMIVFFRRPISEFEFTWRLIAYILSLTLACSLAIALNMLIGTVAKNILFVTAASITYVFFEWIWYDDRIFGTGAISLITPMNLYNKFINPIPGSAIPALFNTIVPFGEWFNAIIPFLFLLLMELCILLATNVYIFSIEDTI
jgi:ABC-2 type transport system permease protein